MNILQQCYDFKILHSCICKWWKQSICIGDKTAICTLHVSVRDNISISVFRYFVAILYDLQTSLTESSPTAFVTQQLPVF
jgi:hypothetical protein